MDGTTAALAASDARSAASWLCAPASTEGRRLWDEAAAHHVRVRAAALKLCDVLADGCFTAAGDICATGWGAGWAAGVAISGNRESSIDAKGHACEIPLERLHNRDGWLVISAGADAADSDPELTRYYFHVRIPAEAVREAVRRMWPDSTPGAAEPVGAILLPPGRPPYEEADKPLLEEILRLLTSREATSVFGAAGKVAPKAAGGSSEMSKAKRLVCKFHQAHPEYKTVQT